MSNFGLSVGLQAGTSHLALPLGELSAKLTERAVCTYIFNNSIVASTVFFLSSYELCTLRRNPTALSAPFGGTSPRDQLYKVK